MKNHSKLFAAAAAALLLSAPAFAQGHGGHGSHGDAQGGHCPHHQATETAVSQALALLDQAKAQNGDQAKATMEKARQQLTEAQKHMDACEKMCEAKMGEGHGGHGGHGNHAGHGAAAAPAGAAKAELVTDPVCGMKIDPKTAAGKSVHAGKTYYFCSKNEKVAFDKDPETYLEQD